MSTTFAWFSTIVIAGLVLLAVRAVVRTRRRIRELRKREARYRELFERGPDPVWIVGRDGRIQALNRATARLFRSEPASLVGVELESLLASDQRTELDAAVRDARAGRETPLRTIEIDRPGDEPVVLECAARATGAGDGAVQFFARDVTERRRLEERLLQGQKMEAVGQLAGGIAHDFGNLMMAVTGYSRWLLRTVPEGEPGHDDIVRILRAGERASWLTRQLMEFSRRQTRRPVPVQLVQLVRDLAPIVRTSVPDDVRIEVDLDARVGRVLADAGQIQVVVLNLVSNARDAVDPGGTVRVSVRDVWVHEPTARRLGVRPGWFTSLGVDDDGSGMDDATRARMFEPFFTTKGHGEGTGLGLSSVYGIAKQNGWALDVRSAPGEGTSIRVLMPHLPGEPSHGDDVLDDDRPAEHRQPTVLIAADSEEMLAVIRPVLEDRGYRVLTAPDGLTALERVRAHDVDIDALLTAVVMAGMSGPELAARLRRERPGLRVVYMSGYADVEVAGVDGVPAGDPCLRKPFDTRELLRALDGGAA